MKKLLILTVAVCLFPSLVFSQNFDRTYPTIGRNCASMKESSARFQLSLNDSQNQNRSTQVTVDSLGNVVSSNVDFAGSGSLYGPTLDGHFVKFTYGAMGQITFEKYDRATGKIVPNSERQIIDWTASTSYVVSYGNDGAWRLFGLKPTTLANNAPNGFSLSCLLISANGALVSNNDLGDVTTEDSTNATIIQAISTSDGGSVVDIKLSEPSNTAFGTETHYFYKVNSSGVLQWNTSEKATVLTQKSMSPTTDGGFITCFEKTVTYSSGCPQRDGLVCRWNKSGFRTLRFNISKTQVNQSNPNCPGFDTPIPLGVCVSTEGGFFVAYRRITSDSLIIRKVKSNNAFDWEKTYANASVSSMQATARGGVMVCGTKAQTQTWAMVLSKTGDATPKAVELATNCISRSLVPWYVWISNVTFNTINNTTEKTRADRYFIGYSDWKDQSTTVGKGQSYPLSINPSLSWSTYKTPLYFRVWIDFNGNGIYEDSEKVLEQKSVSGTVNQWITIPDSATTGTLSMRVSMKKGGYASPCETFWEGEVEDYAVIVQDGKVVSACDSDSTKPVLTNCPVNVTVTTKDTTKSVKWTAPTATDNCTATPSVSSTYNSGFDFPIGTTTVVYTAADTKGNTATCSFIVTVKAERADTLIGTKFSGNDLALSVLPFSPTFSKWSKTGFTVEVENTSNQPFTNIEIYVPYPEGTVNGGASKASIGVFNQFCAGAVPCYKWTISSLNANSKATLDVPLFALNPSKIVAIARLLQSTPIDTISANNTASATITLKSNNDQQSVSYKEPQLIPVVISSITPNPTEGDLRIQLESLEAREVTFEFYNSVGKAVKSETRALEKGVNKVDFSIYEFEQGIYFVIPSTSGGRKVPTKFVKM